MKIISIINQKGGTGKTTTAVNLSSCLASEFGKQVLLIDFDPQGNATTNLNLNKQENGNIYDVLINKDNINKNIVKTVVNGLSVIKSNISLAKGEQELIFQTNGELRLKKTLMKIENDFDYIIIDCPPSLGLLTINALSTSTDVIIPMETAEFPLEGISDLFDTIETVREETNENLNIMGILLTKYDLRTTVSKMVLEKLQEQLKDLLMKTIIKVNIKITEAQFNKKPVNLYDSTCNGTLNYIELAKEVLGNA